VNHSLSILFLAWRLLGYVFLLSEPKTYFWGTKTALIKDPFGYRWSLNQKVEDVSPEETARRAQEFFSS